MHDQEKSDSAIVAAKPPKKAGNLAAEVVEPRAGTKGNAEQQSTHPTQTRARVTQAEARTAIRRHTPKVGAGAPVRICAGGARQRASLPRT
jgi:hypothetical protein